MEHVWVVWLTDENNRGWKFLFTDKDEYMSFTSKVRGMTTDIHQYNIATCERALAIMKEQYNELH